MPIGELVRMGLAWLVMITPNQYPVFAIDTMKPGREGKGGGGGGMGGEGRRGRGEGREEREWSGVFRRHQTLALTSSPEWEHFTHHDPGNRPARRAMCFPVQTYSTHAC